MSRKKGKKVIKEESSSALIVDDPATIVRSCVRCIGDVLGAKGLKFAKYNTPEGNRWELRSGFDCTAYDKRRDQYYPVIPLDPSSILKDNPYWLTFSLLFVPTLARYRLEAISLFVFRGPIGDREKDAFFRAEWYIPADDNKRDAQPHWHVYRTLQDKEPPTDEVTDFHAFTSAEEVKEFGEEVDSSHPKTELAKKKNVPFEKFHFAMASSWHLNDEYQRNFKTEQSLVDWLSRCIQYIRGQLNYVSTKEGTV